MSAPRHPERPFLRSSDDLMLGGVCGGLGRRLGVSPRAVRVVAVLAALLVGFGLVAYVVLWLAIPRRSEPSSIASRIADDRHELQIMLAVATVVVALLVVLEAIGLPKVGTIAWPLGIFAVGAMAVWRGASADERQRLQESLSSTPLSSLATSKSWKVIVVRACAGIALVLFGIATLSRVNNQPDAAASALLGTVALGAGFLVLFAPWWLQTLRELTDERRARVRAQERADVAAHVHDSVLQSLSLIQRAADDPAEVRRLARIQERELRYWLFNPSSFGQRQGVPTTVAESCTDLERDVEDSYGVGVEVVVVGDCPLDEAAGALLASGREATINAAKWSGAASVSVYVEVEPSLLTMYVRDTGVGFDLAEVPADRHGISSSIVDRMTRYGGRAEVRTGLGEGTEVTLTMPRTAAA